MTSSILVVTLVLFISLVFANDGNLENILQSEEAHNTRGLNYLKYSSGSRLRKAIDQQQKLELELAKETTRLTELNKVKESEGISQITPPNQLTKLQIEILRDIAKTNFKIQRLNAQYASSKTLAESLKSSSTDLANNEGLIYDRTKKLTKALEEQEKINLKLAVEKTKLHELKNQKEAENIDDSSIQTLSKWQKNILQELSKTNKNIVELTIDAAVIKTEIELLKQQLSAAGGSLDSITTVLPHIENQLLHERIYKEEKNQMDITKKLAKTTEKLHKLEMSKEVSQINNSPNFLTKKQQKMLNEIEELKDKQHDLTSKAALENAIIEELKSQL